MTLADNVITGDINGQILGLSDEHICYVDPSSLAPSSQSTKNSLGVHAAMLVKFKALVTSALNEGIEIKIASGYRSFERQLTIWNNKFSGKSPIKDINGNTVNISALTNSEIIEAILLFSALPGASRHHWGCDIDVYAPNLLAGNTLQLEPWEYEAKGPMAKLSDWLSDNANQFSFYFPYDQYRGGVAAEPWHLSYIPLAKQYQSAFTIKELEMKLTTTNIEGKADILENLPAIVERYITNVKEIC